MKQFVLTSAALWSRLLVEESFDHNLCCDLVIMLLGENDSDSLYSRSALELLSSSLLASSSYCTL